jgi:hypothetical protein
MFFVLCLFSALSTLWAVVATFLLIRNPLPLPDRGHRAFAVPSEEARRVVLKVLGQVGSLQGRFTFDAGPTHQTLMQDGYTVLNYLDSTNPRLSRLPGNAISLAVKNPRSAAENAAELLKSENYSAAIEEITDALMPPDHLVVVESDAFKGWVLVFRRHIFKMPKVERRKLT